MVRWPRPKPHWLVLPPPTIKYSCKPLAPDIFDYDVIVHPRVFRVHGIDEQDVISAWNNALPVKRRDVPRNS